jgi:hypothetical protein
MLELMELLETPEQQTQVMLDQRRLQALRQMLQQHHKHHIPLASDNLVQDL